jgi:DNA-binding MarR family transcriptional regulator
MATSRRSPAAPKLAKPIRAWLTVVTSYHLCDAAMAQQLAPLGVRLAEHEVLSHVLRAPGLSQQQLAERCFTAKSHISGLVAALEERGWLSRERDPDDGRARRLQLTPEGRTVAERTLAVQAGIVSVMAEAVSQDELLLIEDAMSRVNERLRGLLAGT